MQSGIRATYTALSGVTEVQLNGGKTVRMPKSARQLVGVIPLLAPITPTAAEPVVAKIRLDGLGDVALYNCEFLAEPIAPILGATGQLLVRQPKFWPIYAALNGSEEIGVYGTALFDNTVEPLMGAILVVSDQAPIFAQRKGKVGTFTQVATGAVDNVTDVGIVVAGGSVLESAYGVFIPTTVEASTPYAAFGKITTSDLLPAYPVDFPISVVGPGLSTLISTMVDGIYEFDIELGMANPCTLKFSYEVARSVGTNGYGVIGIVYT